LCILSLLNVLFDSREESEWSQVNKQFLATVSGKVNKQFLATVSGKVNKQFLATVSGKRSIFFSVSVVFNNSNFFVAQVVCLFFVVLHLVFPRSQSM
jgi:hypothetical protein